MPEFRNGRQVRFYIVRYGASFEIKEATDQELIDAGISERELQGMPSATLQEAQAKLAELIRSRDSVG